MKNPSFLVLLLLFGVAIGSCKKEQEPTVPIVEVDAYPVLEAEYTRFDVQDNTDFSLYDSNIIDYDLKEISGLVTGRKNQDVVYVHEDSSNRNVVFVYTKEAVHLGNIVLFGTTNRDWEDIAIGPGPIEGVNYIYVADFGDNNSVREWVRIHRFPEPDLPASDGEPFEIIVDDYETIKYQYPDGPRDAETLLLDPFTKDLFVVTKREVFVHVYQLPYPQANEGYSEIHFRGQLPLKTLVGGDISQDGQQILIKSYGTIYHWNVEDENPVNTLFSQTPTSVEYIPEVQGESVGWTSDGLGYFTITETDKHEAEPILYYYRKN